MTVYLVGAGPGDAGLMTARSLELIATADVVIYDRLIPVGALNGARPDAQLIYAGKEGGGEQIPQAQITAMLLQHGRSGQTVVRLKGGDPFVFGRGGEEAQALREAGIEFEVVPGVTAGVAGPAYAGIPVTHRGAASAVAFVTGHEDPTKPESALEWRSLAAFPGTLVVYMGVRQLPGITARLIEGGRDPEEPAAVVQDATLPSQRVVEGRLGTIAQLAAGGGIGAPAIAVLGPVAALREQLAWLERRPLAGVSVAVTRARAQLGQVAGRLAALGADVIDASVIRIEALDGPLPALSAYDLVVFTSPNGVEAFFDRLHRHGLDARALADAKLAVIGPSTMGALRRQGLRADVMPTEAVGEALAAAVETLDVRRALVARAAQARDVVPEALRARGASVDVLPVYETVVEPLSEAQLRAVVAADFVTFTSASTVRNFLAAVGGPDGWRALDPPRPRLASIGPVTSAELRAHGLEPDLEALEHTPDGLIRALIDDRSAD